MPGIKGHFKHRVSVELDIAFTYQVLKGIVNTGLRSNKKYPSPAKIMVRHIYVPWGHGRQDILGVKNSHQMSNTAPLGHTAVVKLNKIFDISMNILVPECSYIQNK